MAKDKETSAPNGVTQNESAGATDDTESIQPNKPLVLPTQGVEKEVVSLNEEAWAALNDSDPKQILKPASSPDRNTVSLSPGKDPLWSEFKYRKAQTIQREKERYEAEFAKQQQLKALEEAEKKRIEEKRKREMEDLKKEREEKERENGKTT
jgi:hypothetical protein